jgi:3-dehydro-L-gulonate 2-dehydrogenase
MSQNVRESMTRIPYEEIYDVLLQVLLKVGFESERAGLTARLFADASRDGVYSHGVNRFPRFIEMIRRGVIDVHAQPKFRAGYGALEQWDGMRGPGNLNAYVCMARAIALSRQHGIGCVALANTNHWMRGGSYGWQAAEAGVIGICWTNTMPNLPPWGATEPRVGNNPLVIAVPRSEGHIVLDMAMSQFSYGTLESYRQRGDQLPVVGGFDLSGELTRDPGAIEASARPLPIGYWKGSGLALMLDLLAALLSGGRATHQIQADSFRETALSQVFIAIDLSLIDRKHDAEKLVNEIVAYVQGAASSDDGKVRYPGERTLETRRQNLEQGVPLEPQIWQQIQTR